MGAVWAKELPPWSGSPYLLGIAAFMLLYTVTATFLYFLQAEVVSQAFADRGARTVFFARLAAPLSVVWLVLGVWLGRQCARCT